MERARYRTCVAEKRPLITAAELDTMTPDERARVVRESIVHDWAEVPQDVQDRIKATAARLSQTLGTTDNE